MDQCFFTNIMILNNEKSLVTDEFEIIKLSKHLYQYFKTSVQLTSGTGTVI